MSKIIWAALLAASVLAKSGVATAETITIIAQANGTVTFEVPILVAGLQTGHVHGEGAKVKGGVVDFKTGAFDVVLEDFDTGITLRNTHMRNALETAKYPQAHLSIDDKGAAKLNLHGVTKPVVLAIKHDVKTYHYEVAFKLKLSDFNIKPPSHLGITIADEVDVNVDLNLK